MSNVTDRRVRLVASWFRNGPHERRPADVDPEVMAHNAKVFKETLEANRQRNKLHPLKTRTKQHPSLTKHWSEKEQKYITPPIVEKREPRRQSGKRWEEQQRKKVLREAKLAKLKAYLEQLDKEMGV
jgi:hypothetical protein